MTKLKPCPFCGSDNLEVHRFYVTCEDCMTDGPMCCVENAAIDSWNIRKQPVQWEEQNE